MSIVMRHSTSADLEDIQRIHTLAFGRAEEAQLVADLLRDKTARPIASFLAVQAGRPVGHILFTRVTLGPASRSPRMHILAPLAVIPAFQGQGIGRRLIRVGLDRLKAGGSVLVFVLGHPDYYARSGFFPDAAAQGYLPPYPIPPEAADAWMVLPLSASPRPQPGKVQCADTLHRPEYWRE